MDLITWNVQGLGRLTKHFLVKDFLNLYPAEVFCIQSSKLDNVTQSIWRSVAGAPFNFFPSLPPWAHMDFGG